MKRASLVVALAAASAVPAAIAAGGTVVKLDGNAIIERKSLKVDVVESTPIYSGDTLEVADQAIAQVRFEDDSTFVVPGRARFRVDRFAMPSGGEGGKAIYTLVDGGLRTITGSVKEQYELRTAEGTITVEGSAYMALRCQAACAKKYKAGLYVQAEAGTITVSNSAGNLKLRRGQTAYVADKATLAAHVKVSPFNDPLTTSTFGLSAEFETEVHPPRIEPEPPVSPS